MSAVFVLTFAAGAVVLAAWIAVRFPNLAPDELPRVILHVIGAMVAMRFLFPGLIAFAIHHHLVVVGVFGIALPLTTYAMLAGFWTVRFLTGKLAQFGH